ncbi:MAG: VanZ family protein [Bryobacterales bacterium]|nr:VanZ family protein [Bryobacterales bacterium]MBV9397768.1 VanZ family protein [Bryobacterales bacterium]
MPRRRAVLFAALYAGAVLYLSLYPWVFVPVPRTPGLFWIPLSDRRLLLDSVLNVFFYMPLGAAIAIAVENAAAGVLAATGFGLLLSFAVEWTQRYIPFRIGNLNDLLANTGGAFIGAIAALVWGRLARVLRARGHATVLFPDAAILAVLWLAWNAFLLLPAINRMELPPRFVWMETGAAFFGFAALTLALKPHPVIAGILALAPVPALSAYPPVLLIRMAAIAAASLVARFANPALARFLGTASVLWLAFQELYPFVWTWTPQAFFWVPFQSLFLTRPQSYYPLLFGKLFFYTAVIWALRYQGLAFRWAVAFPAAVLAAGEFAQRFMPGRFPESTDLVLMATGAFLLWIADAESRSSAGRPAAARMRDQISRAQE